MFLDADPEDLKPLLDAFGVPIFVMDVAPDGVLRYVAINAAAERHAGLRNADVAGRRSSDLVPIAVAERVSGWHHRCIATRSPQTFEQEVDLPSGRTCWRVTLSPLVRDGRVARLIGTAIENSDLREAERGLRESEQRLRQFLATTSDTLWEMDAELRFTSLSGGYAERGAARLIGKTRWEAVGADPDRDPRWARHRDDLLARRPFRDFDLIWVDDDGRARHRRISGDPVFAPDGTFLGYRGVARDLTEEVEAAHRMQESEQRLALALEVANAGIFDIDLSTNIPTYSASAERMLGYQPGELNAAGRPWQSSVHPDDLGPILAAIDAHAAGVHDTYRSEYRQRCKDGSWRWMSAAGKVIERAPDGTPRRLLGIRVDAHERRQAQIELERMALTDPVTGLPNRFRFRQELERACAQAQRSGLRVGVLVLDLDHFKDVNDTFGHSAGDALLVDAAARLVSATRSCDLVARLGGDEFAILAGQHPNPHCFTYLADRLIQVMSEPFRLRGTAVTCGCSVGITIFPDDHGNIEQLLANADVALYAAKSDGRRTWRLYDRSMQAAVAERRAVEADLRQALELGQFELHYQPVVDLASFEISSVEALVRWNHPVHGQIQPTQFIPVAEGNRMIVPLTEWILHDALMQSRRWQQDGLEALGVAVNISSPSLKTEGLVEYVVRSLATTDADPRRLIIEVTETALADEKRAVPVITALKSLGIRVAVDDFGTGYSSMARLKLLPVDRLKIDRSFVVDAGGDAKDRAIIESIVKLADSLGVKVVAEGIENRNQLELLAGLGCHEGQGFLFARPMPADRVAAWIAAWQVRRRDLKSADLLRFSRAAAG
jgi:diguanylate cyclase (GGDEF)-like protein/PAS domain S-box-containing protein